MFDRQGTEARTENPKAHRPRLFLPGILNPQKDRTALVSQENPACVQKGQPDTNVTSSTAEETPSLTGTPKYPVPTLTSSHWGPPFSSLRNNPLSKS